jgi:integrase
MGQLHKRGGVWWIRFYRNGKRLEESAQTAKYETARDLLREREGQIAKGVPITAKSTRLTFDEAAADVATDYTVNAKRSKGELDRRIALHLTPAFRGRRLSSITTSDLRAFVAKRLDAKAAPAEINRELAIVRRAFRLAVADDKYHGRVPKMPMLQEHNTRSGFFDDAMFAAVRAKLPAALQPVVTFAYVTGWRIQSEILPLEWRHVDRTAEEARLEPGTTKNQAGRVFPFTDDLRALMEALWAEHEALQKAGTICPFVFHRNGRRIKGFRTAWANACAAAGFPGRIPHDLRRSAVRNMERHGLSRSVAMQLTGHKTEAVYRRYAITSEADLRRRRSPEWRDGDTSRGQSAECKRRCQPTRAKFLVNLLTPGWRNWQTHRT